MALNPSGPISLGGTTAGESIAVELGQPGTTQISLNDTAVRDLAGVASGQITMPGDFWGKSSFTAKQRSLWRSGRNPAPKASGYGNQSIIIDSTGAFTSLTTYPNRMAFMQGGGYSTDLGYIYGGYVGPPISYKNSKSLITNTGVLGSETPNPSNTTRSTGTLVSMDFDSGTRSLIYGGYPAYTTSVIMESTGNLGAETALPSPGRYGGGGTPYGGADNQGVTVSGMLYPGPLATTQTTARNYVSSAGVVSSATPTPTLPVGRRNINGVPYGGDKGLIYGGIIYTPAGGYSSMVNDINLIDSSGNVASNSSTPAIGNGSQGTGAAYGGDSAYIMGGTSHPGFVVKTTYISVSSTGTITQNGAMPPVRPAHLTGGAAGRFALS